MAGRTAEEAGRRRARPGHSRLALVFVFLSLCALVAVPAVVQRHVDAARHQLEEVSEPARTGVARLQYSLSRGMSALRGYLLTGAPDFLARYRRAEHGEEEIWKELQPLAEQLGAGVHERFSVMRTLSAQWHQRVEEDRLVTVQVRGSSQTAQALTEQRLFEEILRTAASLDSAIVAAAHGQRDEIRNAERVGFLLTLLLGVLALVSAGVFAWLHLQVRRLAREAEARRRQAEAALSSIEEANEGRVRLLRGVTHDVKNPLGAANGYAELLEMGLKGPLTPEQLLMVQGIRRSVDSALAIIDDLLDVARAESGALPIDCQAVDLRAVVTEAVRDHHAAADASGHTLDAALPPDSLRAHTDPVRVRQVLGNLLSNAIKYTPSPGSIRVALHASEGYEGTSPGSTWAAIHVIDNGPGIPVDQQELIFQEFTRVDDASPVSGHGLGLAISRRIARLLHGEVTVKSAPPEGSTFTLWLPLHPSARAGDEKWPPVAPEPAGEAARSYLSPAPPA